MEERLKIILDNLMRENDEKEINFNESLDIVKDMGFDSVMLVEYIIEVEKEFGVELDMTDDPEIIWKIDKMMEFLRKNATM